LLQRSDTVMQSVDLRFHDFLMIIQSSTIADSENYQFTVFIRIESTILASASIFFVFKVWIVILVNHTISSWCVLQLFEVCWGRRITKFNPLKIRWKWINCKILWYMKYCSCIQFINYTYYKIKSHMPIPYCVTVLVIAKIFYVHTICSFLHFPFSVWIGSKSNKRSWRNKSHMIISYYITCTCHKQNILSFFVLFRLLISSRCDFYKLMIVSY